MIARLGVTVKITGLMPGTERQQDQGNLARRWNRRIRKKVAIRAPVVMPGMVATDIVHGHAQHGNLSFCRIRPVRCHHGSGQGAANREDEHGRPEHEKVAKRVGHGGEVFQPDGLTPASWRRCVIVDWDHGWGQPIASLPRQQGPDEPIWNVELWPKRTLDRIAAKVGYLPKANSDRSQPLGQSEKGSVIGPSGPAGLPRSRLPPQSARDQATHRGSLQTQMSGDVSPGGTDAGCATVRDL